MNRKTPSRQVESSDAEARLRIARAYLKSARDGMDLAEKGDVANPIMSDVVLAAIGFADALTAGAMGRVNKQDHRAVVELLSAALGKRFPAAQKTHLNRILGTKDEVQYGASIKTTDDAHALLDHLERFAAWAEQELTRR